MIYGFSAFLAGSLFAIGLALSGMTDPHKVIGFLDIFGAWDPSLLFVMLGAIGIHFFAYRVVARRESTFLNQPFQVPTTTKIDRPLVIGSTLFGIGWGLAGYCPGPALVSLVTLDERVIVFVIAMGLGMLAHGKLWSRARLGSSQSSTAHQSISVRQGE